MAALPLPGVADDTAAEALGRTLEAEDGVQVPIGGWPARAARDRRTPAAVLLRISAQRYNEPSDYERLAETVEGLTFVAFACLLLHRLVDLFSS